MDLEKLKEPFPKEDIEWRVGRQGVTMKGDPWVFALAYVTARGIMNRLDDVVGAANWQNEYREWHGSSQLCGISIRIEDEWVTKWDGADNTAIESTKGGLSDAMKRAAVQWGIGRYLYDLSEGFCKDVITSRPKDRQGWHRSVIHQKNKADMEIFWKPPALPSWAVPSEGAKQ